MKNKKGFTLIELTISVALLSLIMVFLLNFLTEVKKDEIGINEETEKILNKEIIAKTLNEDIKSAGGINNIACIDNACSINLDNETTKELTMNNGKLTYKDLTNNKVILTKKLDSSYAIILTQTSDLTLIKITGSNKEYDIDITDYQTN